MKSDLKFYKQKLLVKVIKWVDIAINNLKNDHPI